MLGVLAAIRLALSVGSFASISTRPALCAGTFPLLNPQSIDRLFELRPLRWYD